MTRRTLAAFLPNEQPHAKTRFPEYRNATRSNAWNPQGSRVCSGRRNAPTLHAAKLSASATTNSECCRVRGEHKVLGDSSRGARPRQEVDPGRTRPRAQWFKG